MEQVKLSNGFALRRFSLFHRYFAFLDTPSYAADNLFIKHRVTIKFMQEYCREGSIYIVIFARCRKKDFNRAISALRELPDKMLIMGYRDYPAVCKRFIDAMETGRQAIRRKENT